MADLKLYLDQVTSAQAAVQSIVNEIDAAMQLGTPEGTEQALALESKLDEAIAKQGAAERFYNKMVTAMKSTSVLQDFVPVSDTPADPTEEPKEPKTVSLSEFRALSPADRLAFAKRGGTIAS